jgi:hypothetical protein
MYVQHKSKDVGSTHYIGKEANTSERKVTYIATKEMFHSMNYENIN